jgi:pilus assembly protein CpaE
MSNLRIISFRISPEKIAELDQIAKAGNRDRSYILNEAVETYLNERRSPVLLAEKGLSTFLKSEPTGEPAEEVNTNFLIDYQKPSKTVTEEVVPAVEEEPGPLPRPVHEHTFEFLAVPSAPSGPDENWVGDTAQPATSFPEAKGGKLLVFLSAKGGTGVTTLACNFAVALVRGSRKRTLLIDLNLPLGDAAINLGIHAQYSIASAFQNSGRLDASFLSTLLVKHDSGLFVLAAPSELARTYVSADAIDKLLRIARQEFDYVVVDAGSRLDMKHLLSFGESTTVYLVTQVGVPELRNSNRLISQFPRTGGPTVEVVINRFEPHSQGIDEEHITKALTRPARWRIPNDYAAARRMQNTVKPTMQDDTPISKAIQQMARYVCGRPNPVKKEKSVNFLRWKISRI